MRSRYHHVAAMCCVLLLGVMTGVTILKEEEAAFSGEAYMEQ